VRRDFLWRIPLSLAVLSAGAARAQGYRILDPTETVGLEHDDRLVRLKRITRQLGVFPPPNFAVTIVPASRLPANFPVDAPVLRVSFAERSFFDTARTAILPSGVDIIRAMAEVLRGEAPDVAVFVAGHTDNRGTEPYNYNLSVGRANAVADALNAYGVGEVALWRVGFGEAAPLYPNDDDDHMAFNRRVEFLFSARTEPILDVLKRQLDSVCAAPTSDAAERCRRTLRVRPVYEVVQVTARRVNVGLGGASGAPARVKPRDGRGAVAPETTTTAIDPAPKRISIDLRSRRYTIETPTR
jgi:hypothetical protein